MQNQLIRMKFIKLFLKQVEAYLRELAPILTGADDAAEDELTV